MTFNKTVSTIVVCLLSISMMACSSDQITTDLELAVDAAIAAAPVVEQSAGVSPATQQIVSNYLQAAETCMTSAQNILDGGTATAATASQILSACTAATTPSLPAGTPANVATALQAVSNALATFFKSLPSGSVAMFISHPASVNSFADAKPTKMKVDKKKLAAIKAKLTTLHAKLHTK